ncbi:MAG: hypothetical protein J3K34DRAFT_165550 [Monoraphidium minutum]|nr:MAG: hypothetical protein J3K34DRAFT_165550 [Monoraphidium minutum]
MGSGCSDCSMRATKRGRHSEVAAGAAGAAQHTEQGGPTDWFQIVGAACQRSQGNSNSRGAVTDLCTGWHARAARESWHGRCSCQSAAAAQPHSPPPAAPISSRRGSSATTSAPPRCPCPLSATRSPSAPSSPAAAGAAAQRPHSSRAAPSHAAASPPRLGRAFSS